MIQRSSLYCVGIVALLALIAGCSQRSDSKDQQGFGQRGRGGRGGQSGQVVNIRTTTLQRISLERTADMSGTLVSPDQARVSSEVAGVVRDVLVEIGQEVKVGQELVRLDTVELNLALQRAESALRQTEAQLGIDSSRGGQIPPDDQISTVRTATANRDDARAQLARAEDLVSKGLMSKAELDTVQTRTKVAEAAYQAAIENVQALKASLQDRRAAFDLARKKLDDTSIRAPVEGAISERPIQRGEFIRENTPVVTIVRMNPLKLKTGIQEKYANLIRENQSVTFTVEPYPHEMFRGRIAFISPAVDQTTRTFAVEILVDNPAHKLKPGLFAKGAVLLGRDSNVLAVSEDTVSNLAGVSSVFVVENGVIKQTTIQTGERNGKLIEVVSGLQGDEVLAASNLNELVTGTKVVTADDEVDPPAGDATRGNGQRHGGRGGKREGEGGGAQ
jgi:RND family efflux transporter MFP subunit